jgi:hypothetical protein
MNVIGLYISLKKIFDACSYWTNNRALLPNNPNYSYEVNDTYGMTEDDRQFFFKDYIQTVCAETSVKLSAIRKKLLINGVRATSSNSYVYSYPNGKAIFYVLVNSNFPSDEISTLLYKYIQWKVLYYWYWMKNLQQEMSLIVAELEEVEKSIKNTIATYNNDKGEDSIPYNDGFIVNPREDNIDFAVLTTTIVGDEEVERIIINSPNPIFIEVGHTYQLVYSFIPEHSTCNVSFSLKSGTTATISSNGLITARQIHPNDDSANVIRIYKTDDNTIFADIRVIVVATTPPTITDFPPYLYVNDGSELSLSVTATAGAGGTLTYQWFKNMLPITDNATAQTNNLIINPATYTDAGEYYCIVTEANVGTAESSHCNVVINGIFQSTYNTQFE